MHNWLKAGEIQSRIKRWIQPQFSSIGLFRDLASIKNIKYKNRAQEKGRNSKTIYVKTCRISACRRVARIWKRGGGYFWKSEKCANDLDSNFHWPWISFRRFVRNLRWNVSERSKIESFFRPKLDDLQKKKGLRQNSEWFFGRDPKFKRFFRPKLDDPPPKKKKKRSSPKFRVIFRPKSKIQTFFSAQNWVISKKKKKKKKKKKGLRQNSGRFFFHFRKFKRTRGGSFSYGGGYFPFSTENRPQKHKKHAILHTSQANGGGSSPPPPPPGYATVCMAVSPHA